MPVRDMRFFAGMVFALNRKNRQHNGPHNEKKYSSHAYYTDISWSNTESITHVPIYNIVIKGLPIHGCSYNFHEDRIANSKNHLNYVLHILIKTLSWKKLYTNCFAIPDLRLARSRRGCCPAAYSQQQAGPCSCKFPFTSNIPERCSSAFESGMRSLKSRWVFTDPH